MKKLVYLIIFGVMMTACSRTQTEQELKDCKNAQDSFKSIEQKFLIDCISSCSRIAFVEKNDPKEKERIKNSCSSECRKIGIKKELVLLKEMVNYKYNCKIDY